MRPLRALACAFVSLAVPAVATGALVVPTLAGTNAPSRPSMGRAPLVLDANASTQALFAVRNARPGITKRACVQVTYAGKQPARVRLYGTMAGTGLARYLQLEVVRGWMSRGSASCSSFRPDRRNYLGLAPGIVYAGTLAGLPRTFTSAPNDATWHSTRTWRRGASHAYEFVVTLPRTVGNEAQGRTASATFVWEARPAVR